MDLNWLSCLNFRLYRLVNILDGILVLVVQQRLYSKVRMIVIDEMKTCLRWKVYISKEVSFHQ